MTKADYIKNGLADNPGDNAEGTGRAAEQASAEGHDGDKAAGNQHLQVEGEEGS